MLVPTTHCSWLAPGVNDSVVTTVIQVKTYEEWRWQSMSSQGWMEFSAKDHSIHVLLQLGKLQSNLQEQS